jgi:hypothetical protein
MFRLNRNKQKTHPDSLKERIFEYFSGNLGLFRFVTNQICLFRLFRYSKHRNKPNFFIFGFTKQTETNAKQILFRFVSVRTKINFCLFRGHPTSITVISCAHLSAPDSVGKMLFRAGILGFVLCAPGLQQDVAVPQQDYPARTVTRLPRQA